MMDTQYIIKQYYKQGTKLYDIFMDHAERVAKKSVEIASNISHLNLEKPINIEFIFDAAMLHDIGIFMTDSPSIYCMGKYPYVCHGFLGRELLDTIGFSSHALVCEHHTGAGITAENIKVNNLPLPCRDMVPVTVEEEIICFADKFYSKKPKWAGVEKSLEQIIKEMEKLDKISNSKTTTHSERFAGWIKKFVVQQ